MIHGTNKNESEESYREIYLDSSSSLKDFCLDRKKYYRKYILNEEIEDKDSQASIMGKIVETLLIQPELFDEKFYMSACASAPTGLMLSFVEALYKYTREAMNDEGTITKSFEDISRDAYNESGFKIKYEAVIAKFAGSDAEIFYNEICEVRTRGLIVVTTDDVANGEKIVEELKINPVTKDVVNLVDSKRWTIKNQLQIEGYEIDGHLFKSMIDKVVIDHQEKLIQVYDLKCVWAVENFYEEYYLFRRAYIQAYLYWRAAMQMATTPDSGCYGYNVYPPRFIVCDSTNYYNPLIYILSMNDLNDAYIGFEYKGREYPGVRELISNLQWALDNNIWNINKENYLSNGLVKLTK